MSCCDPRSGGPGNDSEDELLAGDQQDKYLATTSSRDEAAAAAPLVPEQKMPETERQPPAVRDQPPAALDAPPAAEPPTPPVAPAAPAAAPGPRHVGVLRHAERIDTLEPAEVEALVGEQFAWPDRVARPYDTPISDFDHPRRAAAQLKEFGFTRVVSSPFRRCLQTAAVAAAELGIEVVDVHKGIGEAMAQVKRNGWPDEPGGHELTYLTEEEMGAIYAQAQAEAAAEMAALQREEELLKMQQQEEAEAFASMRHTQQQRGEQQEEQQQQQQQRQQLSAEVIETDEPTPEQSQAKEEDDEEHDFADID